jgi:hypothetical protein
MRQVGWESVSFTNKTEILFKVALNTIKQTNKHVLLQYPAFKSSVLFILKDFYSATSLKQHLSTLTHYPEFV